MNSVKYHTVAYTQKANDRKVKIKFNESIGHGTGAAGIGEGQTGWTKAKVMAGGR